MTVFTSTLPSWSAGGVVLAADLQTMTDALSALNDAWTAYTPTWASFGTQPAVGNGSLTGKYIQIGKLVMFNVEFTVGSTTTFGTSLYIMSVPTAILRDSTCTAFFEDNSTGFRYAGVSTIDAGSSNMNRTVFTNGTAGWTATSPVTMATSDIIRIAGLYEAT